MSDDPEPVPVLRPRLPTAEQLLPYLRRIDQARVYSNWGPLVVEFQQRLCRRLGLADGGAATAGSGTAAIVGAVLATAGRATAGRPLAVVPGLTFVATALAAEQCGFDVHIADVEADSWALDPTVLAKHERLSEIGVVIVVAPFGRPVPQEPWLEFQEATQIPVVIDAAACFDRFAATDTAFLGEIPVALSFHATKSFATGEGGCVLSTDKDLIARVARALNFGFWTSRSSSVPAINGKLSEYGAAVGLAALDAWDQQQTALDQRATAYRSAAAAAGIGDQLLVSPEVGASYALFLAGDGGHAERCADALASAGLGFRRWYDKGLHRHPHLETASRDDLAVVEGLAQRLIGVPWAPDLADAAVARVVDALAAVS